MGLGVQFSLPADTGDDTDGCVFLAGLDDRERPGTSPGAVIPSAGPAPGRPLTRSPGWLACQVPLAYYIFKPVALYNDFNRKSWPILSSPEAVLFAWFLFYCFEWGI